ncbi:tRNA dihydrouridine synthase, partial [Coemansia sp. RSA 2530]
VLPTWQMAEEYLDICNEVPTNISYIRGHLFKLFRYSLPIHTDLRQKLVDVRDLDGYRQFVRDMKAQLIADAEGSDFDPEAVVVDEFGYRKYPHWICQPALRFEHDKEHSKSKRLLNEAQADAPANDTECATGNCDDVDSEAKRQKTSPDSV